tara:strand:- start:221 stop:937 length:717 start_codon:yes stop_codon:yes gene_type:complete
MLRIIRGEDPSFTRAYFKKPPNPFAKFAFGKRVAVVGGSPQVVGTGQGEYIDSHDIVVRVNCHWPCPQRFNPKIEVQKDIGWRTDFLFHNGCTGGTSSDIAALQGLRGIIFLGNGMRGYDDRTPYTHIRPTVMEWAYNHDVMTYWFNHYWQPLRIRGSTAGFSTVRALLEEPVKEVFITGFDFYSTAAEAEFISDTYHETLPERDFFRDHVMLDERVTLSEHTRRSCEGHHPCESKQQ